MQGAGGRELAGQVCVFMNFIQLLYIYINWIVGFMGACMLLIATGIFHEIHENTGGHFMEFMKCNGGISWNS